MVLDRGPRSHTGILIENINGNRNRKYWGTKWHGNGTDAILWLRLVCDLTVHSFSLYRRLWFSKVFINGGSRFYQTDDRDACLCGSPLPLGDFPVFLSAFCRARVASVVCGVTFALLPKKFDGFCLDGHLLLLILISTSLSYFGMIPHLLLFQFWTIFSFGPLLLNNQSCWIHVVRVCGDDVPSVLWEFLFFLHPDLLNWGRTDFYLVGVFGLFFLLEGFFFSVARISGEFFSCFLSFRLGFFSGVNTLKVLWIWSREKFLGFDPVCLCFVSFDTSFLSFCSFL